MAALLQAMARIFAACALILSATLSACGGNEGGTLALAFVASEDELYTSSLRLSEPAQHLRAATASGLVVRDAQGEIVPALADRWIVTDDGLSFIFRLRSGTWPDGTPITARNVRSALLTAIEGLEGTSMALDLAPVEEVRAMAGRVVELRLAGPFPNLLQLLAQPELALRPEQGTGEMILARQGAAALLVLKPPEERGLPEEEDWQAGVRPVHIRALPAAEALAAFNAGEADAVFGGRIDSLPLVDTGPLSRGTIRLDPAIGLFGLHVRRARGPLASPEVREVISMALDRPALIAPFGIGGWTPTTRVVTPGLADDPRYIGERWTDRPIEDLRTDAARRLAAWRAGQEGLAAGPVPITLAIGEGQGMDLLFEQLAGQLAQIGIRLDRANARERADLVLVDRVARYAEPRWFLNQFNCTLRRGLCDEDVDFLVALSVDERDLATRATLLAEAEAELVSSNIYIPLGTPLRWSLIRGNVNGFVPNRWAFHPLAPMGEITN